MYKVTDVNQDGRCIARGRFVDHALSELHAVVVTRRYARVVLNLSMVGGFGLSAELITDIRKVFVQCMIQC
jgi:hypothetical protein